MILRGAGFHFRTKKTQTLSWKRSLYPNFLLRYLFSWVPLISPYLSNMLTHEWKLLKGKINNLGGLWYNKCWAHCHHCLNRRVSGGAVWLHRGNDLERAARKRKLWEDAKKNDFLCWRAPREKSLLQRNHTSCYQWDPLINWINTTAWQYKLYW